MLREAARARPRRVPVEHARRSLGHRRRAPARGLRGRLAGVRAGDARALRRRRSRARSPRPGAARCACRGGPGLGVEVDAADGRLAVTGRLARRRTLASGLVCAIRDARHGSGRCSCGAWPASSTIAARPRGAVRGDPLGRAPSSPRRARPAIASTGSSSVSSSCQTGSSTPWPAVRRSIARSRGSWLRRPGALRLDQLLRTGRRTAAGAPRRATMSSIGAASIQEARRSSASARSLRSAGSSMPAVAPTVTTPAVARRVAQRRPQREPAAERVADQHRAPRPPRRSRQAALEGVLAWSSRTLG